jgi:hypothetical protein
MASPKEIENWFTYHPPQGDQQSRYEILRDHFKALALEILNLTPACADQTAALRKLRECSTAVNQTIACNEDFAATGPVSGPTDEPPSEAEVSGSHR